MRIITCRIPLPKAAITVLVTLTAIAALTAACSGTPQTPAAGAAALSQAEQLREARADGDARTRNGDAEAETGTHQEIPGNGNNGVMDEEPAHGNWGRMETITVPGTGTADAPPDYVRITLGATQHGPEPMAILNDVTRASQALADEAETLGIRPEDIRTSTFQVQERMVYDHDRHEQRRDGFTATQTTSVTIRDVGRAGEIAGRLINAVGSAGAADLTLRGVGGGLDEPQRLRLMALERATLNLWEQARTVAEGSNRQVCRLLEVQAGGAAQHHQKSGISFDRPVIKAASAGIRAESLGGAYSGGVSINPGSIREDEWVTGVFLMTPTGMQPGPDCGGPR